MVCILGTLSFLIPITNTGATSFYIIIVGIILLPFELQSGEGTGGFFGGTQLGLLLMLLLSWLRSVERRVISGSSSVGCCHLILLVKLGVIHLTDLHAVVVAIQ